MSGMASYAWLRDSNSLEIDVSVLGGTAGDGSVGIKCACAETIKGLLAYHAAESVLVESFNFLNLVGCTETVEEVQERNA